MSTFRIGTSKPNPLINLKELNKMNTQTTSQDHDEPITVRHPVSIDNGADASAEDIATNYVIKGLQFIGGKLAGAYVTAKFNIINPSAALTVDAAAVENCRRLGRMFNYWRVFTGLDIDAQEVAEFKCGLSPIKPATQTQIAQAAELHGISIERAADMLSASRTQMAQAILNKHSHKLAAVKTWLSDIGKLGAEISDSDEADVEQQVADAIIEQYKRAGQSANLISKYAVESFAKQFEIKLPDWASCLPTFTKGHSQMLENVQRAQAAYAEAMARQAAEAELTAVETFGDF